MTAAFEHKTADAIRIRLADIAKLEASHATRDMDAELAEVMRKGGNIDEMETAQLEAEREARRLRVERVALETELPLAIAREGKATVGARVDEHRQLAETAGTRADEVVSAWRSFVNAIEAWEQIQTEAESLTTATWQVAKASGADMPDMGRFQSNKVASLGVEAVGLNFRLASAENPMQVEFRVQGYRIDG